MIAGRAGICYPQRPFDDEHRLRVPTSCAISMKIVLATRNPGKIRELHALLEDLPIDLMPSSAVAGAPDVEEDGETLEENAQKKALALAKASRLPALADDTGLEVDALGGRPGVHSARFAGLEAGDAQNRALLLKEMEGREDRRARFRTVLAFARDGRIDFFEGICEGSITTEERGTGGFGYDPIFRPEGHDATFAEMTRNEKNAISHRGRALAAFVDFLRADLTH